MEKTQNEIKKKCLREKPEREKPEVKKRTKKHQIGEGENKWKKARRVRRGKANGKEENCRNKDERVSRAPRKDQRKESRKGLNSPHFLTRLLATLKDDKKTPIRKPLLKSS